MIQLISHLFGDFVFQNDWMAINKNLYTKKGWLTCFVHCMVYTIFFFGQSLLQLALIFITHFIIDKFSVAKYWTNIFKVGTRMSHDFWLYTYLIFMVDMAFHLACNYFILLQWH
jgi:hypothetical protein